MARQFNLIPPICEQAEYHMFQREKVEVQLPELFHKIGMTVGVPPQSPKAQWSPSPVMLRPGAMVPGGAGSSSVIPLFSVPRRWSHDLVPTGLWHCLGEVRWGHPPLLPCLAEGELHQGWEGTWRWTELGEQG